MNESASLQSSTSSAEQRTGTMRAAVITAPKSLEIQEAPIPVPGQGQVRVRIEGCGVCHSNIPPWEGREWFSYPMEPGNLGHEAWGTIDALGEGAEGFGIGERVAMLSNHAYAQYDVAGTDSIVRLPEELDGVPFPGEPLGCAVNIFRRSQIEPGQTVAIIGIGFLGALLVRLASARRARVIALTRRQYALDMAGRMGAEVLIPLDDHWKIIEQVKSLTEGRFCDVVIECAGQQWPLDLGAELTRERGRLVVAGYHQDGLRQVNMQLWNWRGLDVINAHEREQRVYIEGIQEAARLVASGEIDPSPLYTHTLPLDRLAEAFDMLSERPDGFVKALVIP